MISEEFIKNFFEEQFKDISPFFRYKDHQLLKQNRLHEFIEGQLAKSRNRFIFGIIIAMFGFVLALTYVWLYFGTSDIVHFINSLFWMVMGAGSLIWFSKQYYIIRTSMLLFQKMLAKQQTEQG